MSDLVMFEIIRKYSKYCSICRKKLDLDYRRWHLPFCKECRIVVANQELDDVYEKPKGG